MSERNAKGKETEKREGVNICKIRKKNDKIRVIKNF